MESQGRWRKAFLVSVAKGICVADRTSREWFLFLRHRKAGCFQYLGACLSSKCPCWVLVRTGETDAASGLLGSV